jgi:predicted SprT family Zn-dependent metalloprotease
MEVEQAAQLIADIQSELIANYSFLEHWDINFDRAKRRAGICRLTCRTISISLLHVTNNTSDSVRDTILHEFAHAIAFELYKDTGHGKYWKMIAREIGATPKARGNFDLPQAPWLLVHSCNKTTELIKITPRYRRNKKIADYFLNGRPETKGELFFVDSKDFEDFEHGLLEKNRLVLIQ